MKVVKNKVAPPFKRVEFDIIYGKGISKIGTLLDTAYDLKIVERSGAWYSYQDEKLGQGRDNAKKYLAENEPIRLEIARKVRETIQAMRSEERNQGQGSTDKGPDSEKPQEDQ